METTGIAGTVLVASDLGRGSDEAIRQAAEFAARAGSTLVACHVMPEVFGHRPLFPQLREMAREDAERLRRLAGAALEEQIQRVLPEGAAPPEVRLEAGSAHTTVLEIAREIGAGLIVVGRRAHRGVALLGGVAERIARHAGCPVLIAGASEGGAVVVATDFSDPGMPAIRIAQAEAARRELPLVIVHVVDLQASHLSFAELGAPSLITGVIETCLADARERLAAIARDVPGARVDLREGPATDEILAAAEEAGAALLVMGTHGRTGLGRLALGSVAESVIRQAKTSTLVVRLQS